MGKVLKRLKGPLYFATGFVAALFVGHGIAIIADVRMIIDGIVLGQDVNRTSFLVFGLILLFLTYLIKTEKEIHENQRKRRRN